MSGIATGRAPGIGRGTGPSDLDRVGQVLRMLAAHGVGSAATMARPLTAPQWTRLLVSCRRDRLGGLLAVAAAEGSLAVTDQQLEDARTLHRQAMATVLHLERNLAEVVPLLRDHGIDPVVLKGPAIARLDEADPALRCFADLDLLVRGDELGTAQDALERLGGARRYPEPAPGFDRRFTKGTCITLPSRVEVDLHRTLTSGPYGLLVDTGALHAGRVQLDVGGARVPALDRPRRFLHACYHAVLGDSPPRLVPLRDVARTCPTAPDDTRTARALADSWGGTAVVALALREAAEALAWHPPGDWSTWSETTAPRHRDRWYLSAYVGQRRSYARQATFGLLAVRGLEPRWAYARAQLRGGELERGDRARRLRHGAGILTGRPPRP